MQDYTYALNEFSELINVDDAHKSHKYYCPYCNAPMIPHQGVKRKHRWHFAHKSDVERTCSYETYLHQIAKIKIRKMFYDSKCFNITFSAPCICNVTDCPLNMQEPCKWRKTKTVDLKKYYDQCQLEKPIDGFIADLALTNSAFPNRPPVLIEIYVTHKSTNEKINSGIRIIEIKLQSEDELEKIISSESITEMVYYKKPWSEGIDLVRFYNFDGHIFDVPTLENQKQKFHFWIDRQRHFFHNEPNYVIAGPGTDYGCLSQLSSDLVDSIFRIDASFPINLDFAFNELLKANIPIKYCNMCEFYRLYDYGTRICMLCKSKGTSRYPQLSCANSCPYFKLRKLELNIEHTNGYGYRVYKNE